jgi:hypothetical protein
MKNARRAERLASQILANHIQYSPSGETLTDRIPVAELKVGDRIMAPWGMDTIVKIQKYSNYPVTSLGRTLGNTGFVYRVKESSDPSIFPSKDAAIEWVKSKFPGKDPESFNYTQMQGPNWKGEWVVNPPARK